MTLPDDAPDSVTPDGVLDHVAIAVRSMRSMLAVFDLLFDHELVYGTDDDDRQIRTMQLLVDGRSKIELMEPTSADSPLHSHFDRRGEGLHHLTVRVGDVFRTIDGLTALGLQTTGTDTSDPAWMETYTHPSTCHGTLIQIAQTDRNWFEPLPGLTVDDVLEGRLVWTGSSVVWRDGDPPGAWPPPA